MIKNMWIYVAALVVVAGCGREDDAEIISKADYAYQAVNARYHRLLKSETDADVIREARAFGADNRICSFSWSGMWNNMVGNDYLTRSSGAPLHRAVYFIDTDVSELEHQASKLSARMLSRLNLYSKLRTLVDELEYVSRVIRGTELYAEEDRYIENRRLQQQQLEEERETRRLLTHMATRPQQVVREETVTVVEKSKPKQVRQTVKNTTTVRKNRPKNTPVKTEMAEIDVDDIESGAEVVI